jgi:hypothetical protein
VNRERPRATLRCPQCGFKVALADRQYAELQRRLRVVVSCPRCRLTFPYSAIAERSAGPAKASTVEQPAARIEPSAGPDLVDSSAAPGIRRSFAHIPENLEESSQLQSAADDHGPCLTIVEHGAEPSQLPRRSAGAIWRGLRAPARWLIVAAVILSFGLVAAATVYRLASGSPGSPPESTGAR